MTYVIVKLVTEIPNLRKIGDLALLLWWIDRERAGLVISEQEDFVMGFSNEELTEQEIELIQKTEHEFMVNVHHNHSCYVGHGTVDRGKKIWLIKCPGGYDYDYRELGEKFVLIYGGIGKDNIVELYLEKVGDDEDVEKNKKYNTMFIMYWKIKSIEIPSTLGISREELISVLEDALSTYGIMGEPQDKNKDYYGKVKAIIKESETLG